jgi:alpha,alpha-trehalase
MTTDSRGEASATEPGAPGTDTWTLVYEDYQPDQEGLREALCTLGNGYFATRGAAPDSRADEVHYPGTYLAGGYNRLVSEIAGRKVENEDLVNLPNWLPLTFRIDDGPWFSMDEVEILSLRQTLDLRRGLLCRDLRFRDARGRTTRWHERRLVSMADPHLAGLCVELTAEDWSGRITLYSALDGGVTNSGVARYRDLANRHLEVLEREHRGEETIFLRALTNQSQLGIAQAARTRLYRDEEPIDAQRRTIRDGQRIAQEIDCTVQANTTLRIEKILAMYSSRDCH